MSELQAYYYTKARVWQTVGLEFESRTEKTNAFLKVSFPWLNLQNIINESIFRVTKQ